MLELDAGKLSRPVLRRGNGGNSVPLAGAFWAAAWPCSARSAWWPEARCNGRAGSWLSGTHPARGVGAHYRVWRPALLCPRLGLSVALCGAPAPHLLGFSVAAAALSRLAGGAWGACPAHPMESPLGRYAG